jgi:hypothetical protein
MTKTLFVALFVCMRLLCAGRVTADTRYETQVISPTTPFGWVGGFGFDGTTLVAATQLDSSYWTRQLRTFQVDQQHTLVEQAPVVPPVYLADRFGGYLSVSGDFALMGAPTYSSGNKTGMGIATVLRHGSDGWSSVGQLFGTTTYGMLGQAVDLNGQRLIVGAPGERDSVYSRAGSGLAYVVTTTSDWNGGWTVSKLMGSGPEYGKFGSAVAVDSNIAVVGAPGDYLGQAAAFIFKRNAAGVWSQSARLTGDFAYGLFGAAVDVRDGLVVIGDPNETVDGAPIGAAYAYREAGAGNWVRQAKLGREGATGFEHFGAAVNIGDDGEILVSLPGYDDVSQRHGAAMVFLPNGPNSWQPSAFLLPSVGTPGSDFGRQVELRGGIAVVSAATDFGSNGPIGAEFIYVLVPEPSDAILMSVGAIVSVGAARWRRR